MQNKSYLCNFILKNPNNWRELLQGAPYFINIKENKEYPQLKIFNYNLLASEVVDEDSEESQCLRCDFSLPEVQEARGIIIDTEKLEVVCWPFRKFGNFGESYIDNIDWNTARVQEKVDGSIMKFWFNELSQKWQISSNSVISRYDLEGNTEDETSLFNLFEAAMKNQSLDTASLNKDFTYIFELVSPFNRVVIKYEQVEIYHIGTRNNLTGKEMDIKIGIQQPKNFPLKTLDDCIEAAKALNANCEKFELNQEGFVVVDGNWNRIKIKSPDYVLIHHALNGGILSKKKILTLVLENETEEYLTYYPSYAPVFKRFQEKLDLLREEIHKKSVEFSKLWDESNHDKKVFASKICKDRRQSWGFQVAMGLNENEIFGRIKFSSLMDEILSK